MCAATIAVNGHARHALRGPVNNPFCSAVTPLRAGVRSPIIGTASRLGDVSLPRLRDTTSAPVDGVRRSI